MAALRNWTKVLCLNKTVYKRSSGNRASMKDFRLARQRKTNSRQKAANLAKGSVAQLVKQRISNPKVVSWNPVRTNEFIKTSVGHCQCRFHH